MTKSTQTELLAPARDLECGLAAIDCGADAVYIGAPRYGARAKAGNSLSDVEDLVRYAHRYWARIYVTVNTLLTDDELPGAVRLIGQLYDVGVDALIVQDVGLLECDLPPLPLIASTQMHNDTPAKVAFLEQVGFQRAILARELSLNQIRAIRQRTTIELESFVYGALCVSYSGQCYMSYAIGGRSGNRGECAQPCRRRYSLVDGEERILIRDRHLLCLRDLDLSAHLDELIEAGVTSFKIEGRLKDRAYVMNVVSHVRRQLDRALQARGLSRGSSGRSEVDFVPDPAKTFNRGFTTYYLHGRGAPPGALDTPKMKGELLDQVTSVAGSAIRLETDVALHNGDGLCFFDQHQVLCGTAINGVRGRTITVEDASGIAAGTTLYRNRDHAFLSHLDKSRPQRKIAVQLTLEATPDEISLLAVDEDGNRARETLPGEVERARKPEQMIDTLHRQLARMGNTEFRCEQVDIAWRETYFMPVAAVNELRRRTLAALAQERARNRPLLTGGALQNEVPYPESQLTYMGNVLNARAAAFYHRHGVEQIEPAAESGLDMHGRQVMRTRYCLREQLGLCSRESPHSSPQEPLYLVDEDGHRYRLRFNCADCEMEIFY